MHSAIFRAYIQSDRTTAPPECRPGRDLLTQLQSKVVPGPKYLFLSVIKCTKRLPSASLVPVQLTSIGFQHTSHHLARCYPAGPPRWLGIFNFGNFWEKLELLRTQPWPDWKSVSFGLDYEYASRLRASRKNNASTRFKKSYSSREKISKLRAIT